VSLNEKSNTESLSYWQDVRKRFFSNKVSIAGLAILVFLIVMAIFGPLMSSYEYDELTPEILVGPFSPGHILGTDDLGRDIFRS